MSNLQFNKREIFPNPDDAFFFKLEPIEAIKEECIFVLDANVLLLPFTTGVKSLNAIKEVYTKLSDEDRIFLPAQATREYLDNRSTKITDMNESLSKKMSQNYQFVGTHPLLGELAEYKALEEQERNLREAIKAYQLEIKKTLKVIKSWGWNDPVSDMYHEVLGSRVLSDEFLNIEDIQKDLARRNSLNIPPGYKDKAKDENQAGDLLIWHEILALAEDRRKHLIFVSGDGKPDWWHRSGKSPLYPRFELVDEYRGKSEGKSFHIISLSDLLELYNAEEEVVQSVKSSENSFKYKTRQVSSLNLDLAERSLILVKDLRKALSEYRSKTNHLMHEMLIKTTEVNAGIGVELDEVRRKYEKLREDLTLNLMASYEVNFKAEATLLRDKMRSELVQFSFSTSRAKFSDSLYMSPDDSKGLEEVANDLEFLAENLSRTVSGHHYSSVVITDHDDDYMSMISAA